MVCTPQTHASKPNSFFSISASLKDLLYSILSFIIARSILYQVDRDHAADRKSVHTHVATTATLNPNRSTSRLTSFISESKLVWFQVLFASLGRHLHPIHHFQLEMVTNQAPHLNLTLISIMEWHDATYRYLSPQLSAMEVRLAPTRALPREYRYI